MIKNKMILMVSLFFLFACKKMDSTYEKYIVTGGLTYPAQVLKPLIYAGKNRVKITWHRSSDPNITKARIFWNNYADSLEISISPDKELNEVIVNNLEERSYSFFIRTYDNQGNMSVPTELFGESFGNQYQSGLLSRPINRAFMSDEGELKVIWGAANITGGAYASEIAYTNLLGKDVNKFFLVEEEESFVKEVKQDTPIRFRTVFIPDSLAIDTFYTAFEELKEFYYDKSKWEIVDFSSNHSGDDNKVQNIIDGTYTTRWHNLVGAMYPHFVTVDMKRERMITRFSVERTNYTVPDGDPRGPDTFQLLVSEDNVTWVDLGVFNFNRMLNGEQFYNMETPMTARYFKFIALTGSDANMALGEISVYGH